jgi:hypothetical protein
MIQYHRRYLDEGEKHRRWIDPRLYSIRTANVQAYLLHNGWKPVPPDRPGVLVFQEPASSKDGPLYQFVPLDEQWEGYPAQLYELIAALAEIEDRYAGDVLTDILKHSTADAASTNGPGGPTKADSVHK